MLNYIWAGLIVSSLVFALGYDVRDLSVDRYRNGKPFPVALSFPQGYSPDVRRVPVEIRVDSARYARFYGVPGGSTKHHSGYLLQAQGGVQIRFEKGAAFSEPLATVAKVSRSRDEELQGTLLGSLPAPGVATANVGVVFAPVRFVKLNAIASAALDFAKTAAELALGLVGVLALFLGLLKIAEDSGIVFALVKLVRPILRPLFPGVPPDHPALGMIALNLTATLFGLGNAATPFGIKAMEELQTLNPSEDTATDSMVMLLAINTASLQLVPPVLLLALMGTQINTLIFPILTTTLLGLIVAIAAAKLLGRLPGYRASDPNRAPQA
jgi:spore maturation protein A